ncbi:MAG: CHAT domain-containing protein [Burkholderiales bacterium]|nr:CHAT domain-containing protein [Burkholderiales bacterium]
MASTSHCATASSERPPGTLRGPARWAGLAVLGLALLAAGTARAQRDAGLAPPPPPAGLCALQQGQVRLALAPLEQAHADAAPGPARARAAAAWGQALLRLRQPDRAEALLNEALFGPLPPRERAAVALDLGHLHLARRAGPPADAAYRLAGELAPGDAEVALAVALNRLRLPGVAAASRQAGLEAAALRVPALGSAALRARHALDIAAQARGLGAAGHVLAQQQYAAAHAAALQAGREPPAGNTPAATDEDTRAGAAPATDTAARAAAAMAAEAQDGLAALAEAQGRPADALRHTERGLRHAQHTDERELLVALEWRVARLMQAGGDEAAALAAYRRAVQHLESVRIDMPVQYVDGRSSFRETLEPLYLGLTDLLLRRASRVAGAEQTALLYQARETVELIKQTELEDYLRDRCSVGSARTDRREPPPPATAVYYPIILPDRLELLVETAQGLSRHTVDVPGEQLRRTALDFVAALRNRGEHRPAGDALYRWLVAPIEPLLGSQRIGTLVVVPDGVLRLVPLAALHDGRDYLVRRLALPTVPGLSLLAARSATPSAGPARRPLLAAMSEPGPVLDKLPTRLVDSMLPGPPVPSRSAADRQALREALALPGARQEVQAIGQIARGTVLLDQQFTRAAFEQRLRSGEHAVVHIASHGVFGDSADSTFIMTFDELLTLDGLQALLGDARLRRAPIELITLSACQTAEGDDRAPLGMSGTALKAHARSALGTLWPVSDRAANLLMTRFYRLLAEQGLGKAQALRQAQVELLDTAGLRHPFYWAPFLLLGDWQ